MYYHRPAALKSKIKDRMDSPDNFETMYSLLYSLPAFPNVILPFFGGYSVDTLGVRSCLLVFTSTLALGHVVFCFGVSLKSWPLMFLGRFLFGCGETSTSVANSTMLSDWFEGKELAFSFAFNVAIARLGSVVNNIASPAIASSTSGEFIVVGRV
jgi:MFS family permease